MFLMCLLVTILRGHAFCIMYQFVHHICLLVDDIENAIIELKENNVKLIGDTYSVGVEGHKVIFIHPSSTGGVLLELAQVDYKD